MIRFAFERKQESMREEKEKIRKELDEEQTRLNKALLRTEEMEREKESLLQALEEKQQELNNLKVRNLGPVFVVFSWLCLHESMFWPRLTGWLRIYPS